MFWQRYVIQFCFYTVLLLYDLLTIIGKYELLIVAMRTNLLPSFSLLIWVEAICRPFFQVKYGGSQSQKCSDAPMLSF